MTSHPLIDRLREGKRELRARRAAMSLPEKVREIVRLQHAMLPLIRQRRALREWERPWWPLNDDPE